MIIIFRNLVGFIGAGLGLEHGDPDRSFVIQELMEGGTLKTLVQRQMLQNPTPLYSEAAGLDMCLQVARGLRHLHMATPLVIHRDLKLENLMLACEWCKHMGLACLKGGLHHASIKHSHFCCSRFLCRFINGLLLACSSLL